MYYFQLVLLSIYQLNKNIRSWCSITQIQWEAIMFFIMPCLFALHLSLPRLDLQPSTFSLTSPSSTFMPRPPLTRVISDKKTFLIEFDSFSRDSHVQLTGSTSSEAFSLSHPLMDHGNFQVPPHGSFEPKILQRTQG